MSLAFVDDNFYHIFGCVVGMALFKSTGVIDAYTVDFLGKNHKGLYGSIRRWAAVSWGVGAVIMGHLTDAYGFNVNFYLFGGVSAALLLFITWGFPVRIKSEQESYDRRSAGDTEESQGPRPEELRKALLRPAILFWLVEVAIVGAAMATVETFLFVYLQNELNASTALCGYTVGITVIFELPLFAFSKLVLEKAGHDVLFLAALFAYFLRAFGYSF
uniref:Major facilitator superfamily associated domain-containing protein n=1 Tax=Grammatophora oceanica TaxID=210454 RepID=A0A7S1VKB2_9STRA|mmetsp:Transcript_48869/g.72943  ORF Transcript_48869/g.72943 Transcript_48869/m.72943 type:complete len:217 (+) Transcript_48869:747-1397(+)